MKMILIGLMLLLSSCGDHTTPKEDHGDIYEDNSYAITLYNHPALYGEKDCFLCHQEFSIHREDRINTQIIDLQAIQDLVKKDGINSCSACHGNNDL